MQFQAWVPGTDVRVHVVGSEVFATAITTTATDYRYATAQVDEPARLEPHDLDAEVSDRCVALTADLGLEFAGIDLKISPDGDVYCFEVNPSPAYTYFSGQTRQPIPEALAATSRPPDFRTAVVSGRVLTDRETGKSGRPEAGGQRRRRRPMRMPTTRGHGRGRLAARTTSG